MKWFSKFIGFFNDKVHLVLCAARKNLNRLLGFLLLSFNRLLENIGIRLEWETLYNFVF